MNTISKKKKNKGTVDKTTKQKRNIFKAIKMLLSGNTGKEGELTAKAFAALSGAIFRVSALCLFGAMIVFWYTVVRNLIAASWGGTAVISNIVVIAFSILCTVLGILFGIVLIGMGKDIERERDKDFIIAVFSGLTSFASLAIAVVALVISLR